MQLNDILANAEDQDKGRWLDLVDPFTGKPTGIRLLIAGPDSSVQARGRVRLSDELAEMADAEGRVAATDRERARQNSLARCVLGWEVSEDGQAVPFNHGNVLRLLRAAAWVEAQVDAFAGDRRNFAPEAR
jgi:hypothetical protein